MMKTAKQDYLVLIKGKTKDKAVEAVLEHFKDEKIREEFYDFFNELSDVYEIISPDAFLRPHIQNFDTLAWMYKILRVAYEPGVMVDKEFARKTAKLVQEHTETGEIKSTLDIYEINGDTLKKLEKDKASDTEKVFNLLRSIGITVDKGRITNPYLKSIGEKADLISILFKQRQKDTKETLEELKKVIEEINKAKKEQAEKNMPADVFATYWILKTEGIDDAEEKANSMRDIFEKYPYWRTSEEHERNFKQEILKVFTKAKIAAKKAVQIANKIITILKGTEE
jgi:type I restriction enzyme R subunit